jgi:RNA polymerase sigma-70 factor (ECF subfamily)
MAHGPETGLALFEELESRKELRGYYLLPAAKGDLFRRLEKWAPAADAYRQAISLAGTDTERRFLRKRLAEVEAYSS